MPDPDNSNDSLQDIVSLKQRGQRTPVNNEGFLVNKYQEEVKQKQMAIQNKQKMAVYQSQIKELYMPKISERKIGELEKLKEKIKTQVRQQQPHQNYLDFVYEQNKRSGGRRKSVEAMDGPNESKINKQRGLSSVASHANLGGYRNGGVFNDLQIKKRNKKSIQQSIDNTSTDPYIDWNQPAS